MCCCALRLICDQNKFLGGLGLALIEASPPHCQRTLLLSPTMFSFRNLTGPHRVPSPVVDKKLLFSYAPDWCVSDSLDIIFSG
jgi:hypothetical protein